MDKPTRTECCETCGAKGGTFYPEAALPSIQFDCGAEYYEHPEQGWVINLDEQCVYATAKAAEFSGLAERQNTCLLHLNDQRQGSHGDCPWCGHCASGHNDNCLWGDALAEARLALGLEENDEHS